MIEKEVPKGVKAISVLYFIIAVFIVLIGIISFFVKGIFNMLLTQSQGTIWGFLGEIAYVLLVIIGSLGMNPYVFGLGAIIFSIIIFFIALNLWKKRNWARIMAIIISILWLISSAIGIYESRYYVEKINLIIFICLLILNIIIAVYLLFSPKVKEFFAN